MTTVYLIRHGDTEAGSIISGRKTGFHLSSKGRYDAENLSLRLAPVPFSAIFSSPLERTQETAQPLARLQHLEIVIDERVGEIEFGEWTGMTFDALESVREWKLFHTFRSGIRIPGGELMAEAQTRMVAAIERLRGLFPDHTIAIFSHGDPIRSAICYYTGVPIDLMVRLTIDTASVSVLSITDYGAELLCMNHTGSAPRG